MDVIRRYVFPVIWMLIFALIAIALARLAFFPGDAEASAEDPVSPSAEFDEYALVAAETGDIASELLLPAVVQPDAGTELKAKETGEINRIWAKDGDAVVQGQQVLQVRFPVEPEPIEELPEVPVDGAEGAAGTEGTEGEDGDEVAPPAAQPAGSAESAEQEYRYVTLVATEAGTISGMTLQEWDSLAAGDTVATISPGTYSIVAELTPEQQLSLLDVDIDAVATLPTSTDPVRCDTPDITEDAEVEEPEQPQIDPDTGEETSSSVSAAQLECPVAEGTKIVPGLSVEVTVDLGSANGVLTVPTTAVEGEAAAGTVYVLDEATGEPTPVEVALGLHGDGIVEVTDGLQEGQEILQFVPGVDNPDAEMGGGEVW